MKLDRRVVALAAVTALTFGMPTAAHAGSGSGKGKATAAQQQKAVKAKADAARKKAEEARKKAEAARKQEAVPGTVKEVGATGLTVTRKVRGVTVDRALVLAPDAVVKRDGATISLADVKVGDHVVAHVRSVGGALKVVKLNVERRVVAPPVSDTPTATIGIVS